MSKKHLWLVLPVSALFLFSLFAQSRRSIDAVDTFKNPIIPLERQGGADPAVLYYQGMFYFYSTNPDGSVFTSTNLVNWSKGPVILPDELKGDWAPEVYHHPEDGKFYLYYTQKYKIGVAVADRPDAMFKDLGFIVIDAIDAHLFRDDDSRLYLYFTHTPDFSMHCVPMKSPVETGGPITQLFEISQDWEKHSFPINEGPWMLKHNGTYYLLYSGSNGQSRYYAVGCATAPTPIGPFAKYPDNPVFQDLEHVSCAGHGSVTPDRAGNLWHLYHQKISTSTIDWARDVCLDPVRFDKNGCFGGTPTRGVEQPVPVMDPDLIWSPEITPRGAFFNNTVTISLSSRTDGAKIYYTTDGAEPNRFSAVYKKPFVLEKSATVKARAYRKGMRTSTVSVEVFTQTDRELVPNPAPDAASRDPGFDVFPKPVFNWRELKTHGVVPPQNKPHKIPAP
jgi:GH43 family beta-xylosidase